jgi:hypothetical protein
MDGFERWQDHHEVLVMGEGTHVANHDVVLITSGKNIGWVAEDQQALIQLVGQDVNIWVVFKQTLVQVRSGNQHGICLV